MSPLPMADGDLETAFVTLAPENGHTEEKIAVMLGFGRKRARIPTIAPDPGTVQAKLPVPEGALGTGEKAGKTFQSTGKPAGQPIPATLRQLKEAFSGKIPAWLTDTDPLDEREEAEGALPPPPSLFAPERKRSVLGMTLSVPKEEGAIRLDPLVMAIARGQALHHLPRTLIRSMASGAQLLVDRSEAMMPFFADLDQIEEDIEAVFGKMLKVLSFSCCPLRTAGEGPRITWSDYFEDHVPAVGTRVVCVTDLGIGQPLGGPLPALPEEWLNFQERLHRHGCPLIILTPYGTRRWPPILAKRLDILHWDRETNAARASVTSRRPY